ncbi:MAG: sulfur oxidation c-type cytochrome SoxA [Pseudomonadota bacterium]
MRGLAVAILLALASAAAVQERPIPPEDLRPGTAFQSEETQALEADAFANPALLWVDRGRTLFDEKAGHADAACADCHGADGAALVGAATRYPAVQPGSGRLLNLEGRINSCRRRYQQAEALPYESEALLALTAYVASLSAGMAPAPRIDGSATPFFERGRMLYETRLGQMNLACTQCHDQNYGRMLRGDRISQGHPTGYPAYRLTWQGMGSLHRRLTACYLGVRAEPRPGGDPDYLALELYLAWRAGNLPITAPGLRR